MPSLKDHLEKLAYGPILTSGTTAAQIGRWAADAIDMAVFNKNIYGKGIVREMVNNYAGRLPTGQLREMVTKAYPDYVNSAELDKMLSDAVSHL